MKIDVKFSTQDESIDTSFDQKPSDLDPEFSSAIITERGATYYPEVSEEGIISWTNDRNLDNPPPVNIRGPQGQTGDAGVQGPKGDAGADGKDGADGISPTVSISKSGKVTTISITDKNGTKTATVNDGADGVNGKDGEKGTDGTSVTVASVSESGADGGSNVVTFSDGKTLTVKNGTKGSKGDEGYTPVKGTDYWTASDKSQMVSDVLAALPTWNGGSY